MNGFIDKYYRFYFWITVSRYIGCKHCCLNCQFYNQCLDEYTDMEKKITPKTFFD